MAARSGSASVTSPPPLRPPRAAATKRSVSPRRWATSAASRRVWRCSGIPAQFWAVPSSERSWPRSWWSGEPWRSRTSSAWENHATASVGCVGGDRRLARSAGVVDGLGHIGLAGGGQPVAGQSCQSLGVFDVSVLQHLGYPLMGALAASAAQDPGTGCAASGRGRSGTCRPCSCLGEDPGGDGLLHAVHQFQLVVTEQHGEHRKVEVPADDRGHGQRSLGLFTQGGHPLGHHLADTGGEAELVKVDRQAPRAFVVLDEGSFLGQVTDHLDDEEGVAPCLPSQRMGQGHALVGQACARRPPP